MEEEEAVHPTDSSGSDRGLIKRFQTECCGTGREYVPYQAYFFSFFAGIGAFLPYLVLYFKRLGLSASQAGILFGMRPLSEIFTPLWGWLGDKYKVRKTIVRLAVISYALSALVTLAVQPKHQKCVAFDGNLTQTMTLEFSRSGVVKLEPPPIGHTNRSSSLEYQHEVNQQELNGMFALILLITILGQLIGCVNFTFPEALTIAFLEERSHKFGVVRFPGEVGLVISTFAVGAALSATEKEVCGQRFPNYFIAFYCFAAWMATCLIVTLWMKTKYHDTRENVSLKKVINSMTDLRSISFLLVSVFLGSFQGLHESFGLWFIEDLGGSSLIIGVASGLRYTFSSFGYITAQVFISRLGVLGTLATALVSYGIVFCGFSLSYSPVVATVFFVLQGGIYSLAWCAVIAEVGQISQQTGYTASIQGVFSGAYWGLGYGGGAILSGVLVQLLGVPVTYQLFSVVAVLLCIFLYAIYWSTGRHKDEKNCVHYKLLPGGGSK